MNPESEASLMFLPWPRLDETSAMPLGLKTTSIRICLASAMLAGGLAGCGAPLPFGLEAETQKTAQERYTKAKTLFEERCKTAGVVIKRTVKDVEGIELIKIRQPIPWGGKEYFDAMYPEAAMAGEHRGDDYIKQFLMSEFVEPSQPDRRGGLGPPTKEKQVTRPGARKGYAFVEYVGPSDGQRYRCTPDWSLDHPNWVPGQHHCSPIAKSSTRYALDYEDLVVPEDRSLWIAGTKLRVIDKQTGEVVAELTRYVWDMGFGSGATGRWPWEYAAVSGRSECMRFPGVKSDISRKFIDTVIQPKQGD
ncbi:hypothetical protein ACS5PN_12890 [Roseateles sp. NT4]|uniref:hypothetical protein n=1 Tax=Roseateles sp. NT4 TaxID=3453715 RepID=UPI003EF01EFE